jgi:hypothetical protein
LKARSPEEKFLSSLPTMTLKNLDKSKCVSLYKLITVCHSIICWWLHVGNYLLNKAMCDQLDEAKFP